MDDAHHHFLLLDLGYDPTHDAFHICRTCLGLYETRREGLPQRCKCDRVPDEPRWPRHDFNERACLCECCVSHVLESGSRWSVWFCDECKDRVLSFNDQMGAPVIPIGRHSLMHGVSIAAGDVQTEGVVSEFVDESRSLFERMDLLDEYARDALGRRLSGLGFPAYRDVSLSEYLTRIRSRRETDRAYAKPAAFEDLVDAFRA